MAKAKKLPSGSWRCQVYDFTDSDGKRYYKSFTAETKKESEYLAAEFALNKKQKTDQIVTWKDGINNYISSKEPVLSPSTIRGYKNIEKALNNDFKGFCKLKIYNTIQEDVQDLINTLCQTKGPKTVRNYHSLISAIMAVYRPEFALNTTLPQKVRPNLYIPSDEEVRMLMLAVKDTELEIPVMLAAFGTMRRGEICALTMEDITENVIHVRHSLVEDSQGNLKLKAPKTYSGDRYVEVPEFVINRIKEKGYITKLKPQSVTIMFGKALVKNNIPPFRFHDLRHYSASVQHALGIPDAYIMQRGGWGSDSVLKGIYRHAMDDRQKDMNQIANNHFKQIMQHEMQHEKKEPQ